MGPGYFFFLHKIGGKCHPIHAPPKVAANTKGTNQKTSYHSISFSKKLSGGLLPTTRLANPYGSLNG